MDEEGNIRQIKPKQAASGPKAESILIPKIDPQGNGKPVGSEQAEPLKNPGISRPKTRFKPPKFAILGLGIIVILFLAIALPAINVLNKAKAVYADAQKVSDQAKAQNLPGVKSELSNLKSSTQNLKKALIPLGWIRAVPLVGPYVSDANHAVSGSGYALEATEVLITAVEPYADIIGFTGGPQDNTGGGDKTTQAFECA